MSQFFFWLSHFGYQPKRICNKEYQTVKSRHWILGQVHVLVYLFSDLIFPDLNNNFANCSLYFLSLVELLCAKVHFYIPKLGIKVSVQKLWYHIDPSIFCFWPFEKHRFQWKKHSFSVTMVTESQPCWQTSKTEHHIFYLYGKKKDYDKPFFLFFVVFFQGKPCHQFPCPKRPPSRAPSALTLPRCTTTPTEKPNSGRVHSHWTELTSCLQWWTLRRRTEPFSWIQRTLLLIGNGSGLTCPAAANGAWEPRKLTPLMHKFQGVSNFHCSYIWNVWICSSKIFAKYRNRNVLLYRWKFSFWLFKPVETSFITLFRNDT